MRISKHLEDLKGPSLSVTHRVYMVQPIELAIHEEPQVTNGGGRVHHKRFAAGRCVEQFETSWWVIEAATSKIDQFSLCCFTRQIIPPEPLITDHIRVLESS